MIPTHQSSDGGDPRQRRFKILAVSSAALIALSLLLLAIVRTPVLGSGLIVLFGVLLALIPVVVGLTLSAFSRSSSDKRKRGLNGLDMYSMIDRLVDDLDDDEAAYLQSRLDQRAAKTKNDLAASLGELLDQREEQRQSQQD